MRPRLLATLLLVVGCTPQVSEVRRARGVAYRTDFARVWNVLTREMHATFPEIVLEDAVRGTIASGWRSVGAAYFRMRASVRAGRATGPWIVTIEGEAAEKKPGMTLLVPFRKGAIDEPAWISARVDRMYVRLYRQLERHAVVVERPRVPRTALPTERWPYLPDPAAELIARVHAAARKRDAAALRPLMKDAFLWSLGADASADRALALWSADPSGFAALRRALEGGCRDGGDEIRCGSATFRRLEGRWWFVAFLAPSL